MDLQLRPEELAFRRRVRAWLRANVPKRRRGAATLALDDPRRVRELKDWQRRLHEAGFLALGWPREHGGQRGPEDDPGDVLMRQTILGEEMVRARAPGILGIMGLQMVGPTLMQYGTEEQKHFHLPRILRAEEIWCQGYSEPGAGSDLASLQTRAELRGDVFVVNGQKVWTSNAQIADWMFCLVRTNPHAPKHRGISYLLIDMKSPGIHVRPLVQMTGDKGFNEVFFDDVRVPRANLVGALDDGWRVANATLAHERNLLGSTTRTQQLFQGVLRLARRRERDGRRRADDPVVRQRLAELETRVEAMKLHSYRCLTDAIRGRSSGVAASVSKLASTELNHALCELALELLGESGNLSRGSRHAVDRGVWPWEFQFTLGMVIGGGTSQIQKNIIAGRGLGMPKGL